MKKIGEILLQFIFASTGIVLIGALPSFISLHNENYFNTVGRIIQGIFRIQDLEFYVNGEVMTFYPYILEAIIYSFTIVMVALIMAYLFSTIFTILTMMSPRVIREKVKSITLILESLPDILVIILLQLFVIYVFKETNILIMKVVAIGDEKAYLLPIISLSILPTVQLYRVSILLFEEELQKDYIVLGKSKGIKWSYILIIHVLRNTMVSLLFHFKKTIWYMLSALIAVELLSGINGITYYLTNYMNPEIFTIALLGFFIPIFFVYHFIKWFIEFSFNKGEQIS